MYSIYFLAKRWENAIIIMTLIVISISTDCEIQMNANSQNHFVALLLNLYLNLLKISFLQFSNYLKIHYISNEKENYI